MTLKSTPFDERELRDALAVANLPTLLMVMYQLSGDRKWIEAPYQPVRTKTIAGNDSGGFPEDVQQEIRDAAYDLLVAWGQGEPMAYPTPDATQLVELITICMGEEVPAEFGPMFEEDMRAMAEGGRPHELVEGAEDFSVAIIGAGVSGIAAAVELQAIGIRPVIFEKNPEVGGTWFDNRYPGCGVDTPSHVYSFSFHLHRWSTYFGKRDEVLSYLQDVARSTGVRDLVEFETEVLSAVWHEQTQKWRLEIRTADGRTERREADVVITAVGQLNRPSIPSIPGAEDFRGPQFHSAQWPEGYDVSGLRVGIIGSGASAMQIVPAVADSVAHLSIFQRSPQWAAPSDVYFAEVPDSVQWLLEKVPNYELWYRLRLFWMINDRLYPALRIDPTWEHPERSINAINDGHRRALTRYIESELADRPDLLEKSLPTYPPFGKRMLLDNGWFKALKKPGVDLITDGVASITADGVVTTAGEKVDLDVIVYATGFEAKRVLYPLDVRGRGGVTIRERWGDEDARAYLGMTAPDFPNLFVMFGPNINLGHGGSYMFAGEMQARYITQACAELVRRHGGALEVRRDVHDTYNEEIDAQHAQMIWSHRGMDTWYRNAAGRIVTNSPWRVVDYWAKTRELQLGEFQYEAPVRQVEAVQ